MNYSTTNLSGPRGGSFSAISCPAWWGICHFLRAIKTNPHLYPGVGWVGVYFDWCITVRTSNSVSKRNKPFIKSKIWKKKEGQYAGHSNFSYARYAEKCFIQISSDLSDVMHAVAHPDGLQNFGQKPTEKSVTEFCYKSVNLFLEDFKNIEIILFLIHELFR